MNRNELIIIINNVVDENQCLGAENIADAIIEYFEPKILLDNAIQQITGYIECMHNSNIISLVESMALTLDEWMVIRDNDFINKYDIKEDIDNYFNIK